MNNKLKPLPALIVIHCHGSKYVVGVAHARATAVIGTPRMPGSTSGGGCGHLLLDSTIHRKPTHKHRRLRREPKARECGEQYTSVAVVASNDPGQHPTSSPIAYDTVHNHASLQLPATNKLQ